MATLPEKRFLFSNHLIFKSNLAILEFNNNFESSDRIKGEISYSKP
jgi:hypothetical protein